METNFRTLNLSTLRSKVFQKCGILWQDCKHFDRARCIRELESHHDDNESDIKRCNKCLERKSLNEFVSYNDIYEGTCKICRNNNLVDKRTRKKQTAEQKAEHEKHEDRRKILELAEIHPIFISIVMKMKRSKMSYADTANLFISFGLAVDREEEVE